MFHIYVISRTSDGRAVYVGQTVNLKKRMKSHFDKKSTQVIGLAIKKHGPENFRFEAMPICFETRVEADDAEIHMIKALKTHVSEGGYNVEWGGNGRGKVADETRLKLSALANGREFSAETRAKLSVACKGREFSAESRAKMAAARTGRKLSVETRTKMSAAGKGRQFSAETRLKLAAAARRRKHSAEARAKLSAANRRRKKA